MMGTMAKGLALAVTMAVPMIAAPAMAQDAAASGNAAAGKAIYARCAVCHDLKPGPSKLGPHLNKIVGRKAASIKDFAYSPALKAAKITWTREALDKYLASPRAFVPGTKMAFGGISKPEDRANLIAFMEASSK